MVASIPASAIVNVIPNVITAGGSGLDLVGLILTDSVRVPVGGVQSFSSAADVAAYFGAMSTEATLATVYFAGYLGSPIKPAALLFSQYPTAPVAAYLRGGSLAALTLTALKALTGVITITVDGVAKTSSAINLSAATSFSNAATIIAAAFTSPGFTVTYDSIASAFVFTSSTTGASSTVSVASGSLAAGLALTTATGAVLSQGAIAATPTTAMAAVIDQTQDFVSFTTSFQPAPDVMLAFAAWTNTEANRFLYAMWDNDAAPTTGSDTTSVGYEIAQAGYSGIAPIYDPNNGASLAAFLMGAIASIDFQASNGRITTAFRSGAVLPGVTNRSIADNLIANGYNFYGSYATANDQFTFFYPGRVSGEFEWIDSWIDQVWMNNGFQISLMSLLTGIGSIPYNAEGYGMIATALQGQIDAAVSFGAIRAGITLTPLQAEEVNTAAGIKVSDTLQQRGWYVRVGDASPDVRAARGSPPVSVFYTDGQSIQKITLSSVLVQ
jgi:hypothetical protein